MAIATTLYGNRTAGVIIYAANALACFTIALVVSRRIAASGTPPRTHTTTATPRPSTNYGECLVNAVGAARCFGVICLSVIAFNIAVELLRFTAVIRAGAGGAFAASLIEISNISLAAGHSNAIPAMAVAALTSFGGACVMFQIYSLGRGQNLTAFAVARPVAAALSALYCYVICTVTGSGVFTGSVVTEAVSAVAQKRNLYILTEAGGRFNAIASVALLIMTAILLISISKPAATTSAATEQSV
ncbi:hypothetical protein FACS1894133_7510 [Clostridia bacterium]|nr:hypothetical protein FACS1894133_7510 [Clostridia bacterium]